MRECVNPILSREMVVLEMSKRRICCSLVSFSRDWNLGIDLMLVRRVRISLDISSLLKPKLMIFWRKGRKERDEERLAVSAI